MGFLTADETQTLVPSEVGGFEARSRPITLILINVG
jgi:hypothetical protein